MIKILRLLNLIIACTFFLLLINLNSYSQSKQLSRFALVIGNSRYEDLPILRNPGNDAVDVANSLKKLGFNVKLLLNSSLLNMEDAILDFIKTLNQSADSIGFFYYAGHAVQSNGSNFLIPSDARLPGESYLRLRTVPVQAILDNLSEVKNYLNVLVLDSCRDNPFSWARSGSRGLSVTGKQPSGSIVVYSTSVGSVALDGEGRNGVFTSELLKHLPTPGIDIDTVFKRTGAGVRDSTKGSQIPAIYNQFFSTVFLAEGDLLSTTTTKASSRRFEGNLVIESDSPGTLYLDDIIIGKIRAQGYKEVKSLEAGLYSLKLITPNGKVVIKEILIQEGLETAVSFFESISPSSQDSLSSNDVLIISPTTTTTTTTTIFSPPQDFLNLTYVKGGKFMMGSEDKFEDERPIHMVEIDDFWISKFEITQEQYFKVMKINPSRYTRGKDALTRPVERVSWLDAIQFCNTLSALSGLDLVYTQSDSGTICDFFKNGYRLPTEAEWEYAAKGGGNSKNFTYSGSNDVHQVAWFEGNSGYCTHSVGEKKMNELGLFDMSGNIAEFCWDFYGDYSLSREQNYSAQSKGRYRIVRGGSWYGEAHLARPSSRYYASVDLKTDFIGFRVLRSK